jgi:hypothetical protein
LPYESAQTAGHHGRVLLFAAAAYGLLRAAGSHPLLHPKYRSWLATTPWRRGMPLPLGPAGLVLQDALVLAGAVLLAHDGTDLHPAMPLIAFGGAYLPCMAPALASTKALPEAIALAFGLPVALLLRDRPWAVLGVLAALFPLASAGLWRSLGAFPWESDDERRRRRRSAADTTEPAVETAPAAVGWYFSRLGPRAPMKPIGTGVGLLVPALLAWWTYALADLTIDRPDLWNAPALEAVGFFAGGGLGLLRLVCYVGGYHPPITLWGRLRTGRLIVPGYDYVYIAPLSVLAAGLLAPAACAALGANVPLSLAITAFATLWPALNLGPTLRRWRLTGHHRVMPSRSA